MSYGPIHESTPREDIERMGRLLNGTASEREDEEWREQLRCLELCNRSEREREEVLARCFGAFVLKAPLELRTVVNRAEHPMGFAVESHRPPTTKQKQEHNRKQRAKRRK